jgi:hypothetical protein
LTGRLEAELEIPILQGGDSRKQVVTLKGEAMRNRISVKRHDVTRVRSARQRRVVAAALMVTVIIGSVILAQRSSLRKTNDKEKPEESSITPAAFDPAAPSKEYVYAGATLIATEEQTGGGTTFHRSTIGVFRPSIAYFFLRNSNTPGPPDISAPLGAPTDIPVVGDWDGNGTTTIGVFRPATGSGTNTFYLSNSSITVSVDIVIAFGAAGDMPIVGDWDGNGTSSIGVFRPATNTFYLSNSLVSVQVDVQAILGAPADLPIVGDWDGNGTTTIGVYRRSSSTFFLSDSLNGGQVNTIPYGAPNLDIPILGDWDGNGTVTVGVYRPNNSTFYLRNNNSVGIAEIVIPYGDGPNGDRPVAGDWDGL